MESRNTSPSKLLSLHSDIKVNVIGQFLNPSAILNLRRASKHYFPLFFERPQYAHARSKLKNLLSSAALGEWESAEKIWKMDPGLLIYRSTIYHPNYIYNESGEAEVGLPFYINPGRYRYVDMSVFQIALVNEEWDEAALMAEYMSVEEQQKQLAEVFPDGNINKNNWDLEKAKQLLQGVFAEVIKDPAINENNLSKMSESTRKALFALYAYAKPKAEHKTGLVFDANFYLEALKMYEEQFGRFENWHQGTFWCIRVEEWLAGCLGTAYLRPHAQGVGNNLHRRGCILEDRSSYFSFRRLGNSVPGFHHFVGYYGARPSAQHSRAHRCDPGGSATREFFRNLCQAKTRAGTDFMRRYSHKEKSACLVC